MKLLVQISFVVAAVGLPLAVAQGKDNPVNVGPETYKALQELAKIANNPKLSDDEKQLLTYKYLKENPPNEETKKQLEKLSKKSAGAGGKGGGGGGGGFPGGGFPGGGFGGGSGGPGAYWKTEDGEKIPINNAAETKRYFDDLEAIKRDPKLNRAQKQKKTKEYIRDHPASYEIREKLQEMANNERSRDRPIERPSRRKPEQEFSDEL